MLCSTEYPARSIKLFPPGEDCGPQEVWKEAISADFGKTIKSYVRKTVDLADFGAGRMEQVRGGGRSFIALLCAQAVRAMALASWLALCVGFYTCGGPGILRFGPAEECTPP